MINFVWKVVLEGCPRWAPLFFSLLLVLPVLSAPIPALKTPPVYDAPVVGSWDMDWGYSFTGGTTWGNSTYRTTFRRDGTCVCYIHSSKWEGTWKYDHLRSILSVTETSDLSQSSNMKWTVTLRTDMSAEGKIGEDRPLRVRFTQAGNLK
jgi:hypothetical protein